MARRTEPSGDDAAARQRKLNLTLRNGAIDLHLCP
jgi:hypothetical protein